MASNSSSLGPPTKIRIITKYISDHNPDPYESNEYLIYGSEERGRSVVFSKEYSACTSPTPRTPAAEDTRSNCFEGSGYIRSYVSGVSTQQDMRQEMRQKYKENKAHLERFIAGRVKERKQEEEQDLLKVGGSRTPTKNETFRFE